jgi:prevent-host-death family protein
MTKFDLEAPVVTVNIHEAKTHLSKLVDRAAGGETVVIARAGKPLVRVSALDAPAEPRRLGFLASEVSVPDDFDRMGSEEIAALFGAGP